VDYPTGLTPANPGDSLTWTATATLSHRYAEVLDGRLGFSVGYTPGPPIFSGSGAYFAQADC
jgi:hypothetical protein